MVTPWVSDRINAIENILKACLVWKWDRLLF
jgi:hypothetical protein